MKSGNLNFLEPSGPLQACNGTALPLLLPKNKQQPHHTQTFGATEMHSVWHKRHMIFPHRSTGGFSKTFKTTAIFKMLKSTHCLNVPPSPLHCIYNFYVGQDFTQGWIYVNTQFTKITTYSLCLTSAILISLLLLNFVPIFVCGFLMAGPRSGSAGKLPSAPTYNWR